MKKNIAAVLLAAGKGTRMKSYLPKVVHEVCGLPLILHVIRQLKRHGIKKIVVVVGYGKDDVIARLASEGVEIVEQREQLGTGHALSVCEKNFKAFYGDILVLPGDVFIEKDSCIKTFCAFHAKRKNELSILTAALSDPKGYGRIIRGSEGTVTAIREELDATAAERAINEINTGIYLFKGANVFKALKKIKRNPTKKEYYLTDIVDIYVQDKKRVDGFTVERECAILGVNDRAQLADIHRILKAAILQKHQMNGVTILEPESTYIEVDVTIGADTVIYPYTYIEKNVTIGERCQIGPFCKVRSHSKVNDTSCIGSFVELVRSTVGKKTNIKHLSYIGDAVVGNKVNIGAGTITANYDGKNKNKTYIKDGAFIGSNSVLVAPVSIEEGAKTGAGSVVLSGRNVPRGKVVCGVPARIIK